MKKLLYLFVYIYFWSIYPMDRNIKIEKKQISTIVNHYLSLYCKESNVEVQQPEKPWFSWFQTTPSNLLCYFNPDTQTKLIATAPNKSYTPLSHLSLQRSDKTYSFSQPFGSLNGNTFDITDIVNVYANKTETLFYCQGISTMFQYDRNLIPFLIYSSKDGLAMIETKMPYFSCLVRNAEDSNEKSYIFLSNKTIKRKNILTREDTVLVDLSQQALFTGEHSHHRVTSFTSNDNGTVFALSTENKLFLIEKNDSNQQYNCKNIFARSSLSAPSVKAFAQGANTFSVFNHIQSIMLNHSGTMLCVLVWDKAPDRYSSAKFTHLELIDLCNNTNPSTIIVLPETLTKDASWNQYLLMQFSDDDQFITISNGQNCCFFHNINTGISYEHSEPHSYLIPNGKGIIRWNKNKPFVAKEIISDNAKTLIEYFKDDSTTLDSRRETLQLMKNGSDNTIIETVITKILGNESRFHTEQKSYFSIKKALGLMSLIIMSGIFLKFAINKNSL